MRITMITWHLLLALCASLAASRAASALDAEMLYRTQAIVTGIGEANRQLGFEECFRDVLVKVSGDQRLLREAKVLGELPAAGGYVASFRYRDRLEGVPIHDEQGTHDRPHDLYCAFDRPRIDAFLAAIGRKPWLHERPRITLFLTVSRTTKQFVLTRDGNDSPYMRDSLLAAAEPLAMQVDVPSQAVAAAAKVEPGTLPRMPWAPLTMAARAAGGDMPLRGSLVWSDADLGWIADWELETAETRFRWQLRGVSFDDAFRNAASGALQVLSGNGQPD